MSQKGNKILKELHENDLWLEEKRKNIKNKIIERGGHAGKNNPMYGRKHSENTSKKMKKSASIRNNENIGRYNRTKNHRDNLSRKIINRIKEGRLVKTSNTKPELLMKDLLDKLNIPYKQQFLIQFKNKNAKMFRHLYDFHIPNTNILIEVDGDYWHSKPEIQERDIICNQVAESKGFDVYRFSENLIKNDIESIEKELLTIKKSQGV